MGEIGPRKGPKEVEAQMAEEIVAGGLYAIRAKDGWFQIVKVLVVDAYAVHFRSYANRFRELPSQVRSSELSLGIMNTPAGFSFGIGHFPLDRIAFESEDRVLVGHETVAAAEVDGYRIWVGSGHD